MAKSGEREDKLRAFAFNGSDTPANNSDNLADAIATHLQPQKPKAKRKFAVDIDVELHQAFKEECTSMGIQLNEATEFLLREFLKARGRKL